ncbi:MAG: DUF4445 domain-containing protein [Thermoguttaceae bacterium]|nr:DUF4445 domain-containing protein [Planctomycetaceae bacterium]MBQ4142173.1 DUF4445 domain-containing protein [Thermoguttaceae bacterium]
MKIHFPNQAKTVDAAENARLSDIIRTHLGEVLPMPCGGGGTCGKCTVQLASGETVRACQTVIDRDMTVLLPEIPVRHQLIQTRFAPELLEKADAWERRHPASGPQQPGGFSLAFDLGTTTLAASLIQEKSILATVSRPNPQAPYGADVISRIEYGTRHPAQLAELQSVLLKAVLEMTRELFTATAALKLERPQTPVPLRLTLTEKTLFASVRRLVFAGNTTMLQTLAGLDLSPLALFPFAPSSDLKSTGFAGDPCWKGTFSSFRPETRIFLFPVIGAFVGGDITAGMLALHPESRKCMETYENERYELLLDLGTNGELVLKTPSERIACATAAGPCFEGAKISCGMCAETGAVLHVEDRDGKPFFETMCDEPAVGICGSALIDLTAELLRLGILTADGRLLEPEELSEEIPAAWSRRIRKITPEMTGFHISGKICVTQEDFRELQLAVGAIRTGIQLLMRRGKLRASQLTAFHIAGGFGKSLRIRNAQRIGLIPVDVPPKNIHFLGNTSLAGSIIAARTPELWTRAETLARKTQCIDLALEDGFADVFMDSMLWGST